MRNDRFSAAAEVADAGFPAHRHSLISLLLLIFLGLCLPISARAADVVAYPLASCPGYINASSWTISATGADGINVHLSTRAYEPENSTLSTAPVDCYYSHCAISGSTTFYVDGGQTITSYSISPSAYHITASIHNGTTTNSQLQFTVPSTEYLEVKINSKATLCLLADPLETNAPNPTGSGIYNVVSQYSADNTGSTDTTNAIQNAINAANAGASGDPNGVGIVYFPAGVYKSSTLTLKSNVALYFAGGSVLYGDPTPPTGQSPPLHQWGSASNYLIEISSGATNVEVYGRGELYCNGSVIAGGLAPSTHSNIDQVGPIRIDTVNGVQIYGITVSDSTEFTMHPSQASQNITVANMKIINRYDWLWNDGMDFTDSYGSTTTPCTVTHCFVRTCDDATTVKTGYSGTAHSSHDITYTDMVIDTNSGCGFCAGAETNADIYNITATNYKVIECNRGMALLHRNGTGSWHDMTFETWTVDDIDDGINTWNSNNKPPLQSGSYHEAIEMEVYNNGGVGPISNILCQDMTFLKHGPTASYIWGDPSPDTISNVTFNNLVIYNSSAQPIQILSLTTQVDGQEALWNMAPGNSSNITFHASP